MRRTLNKAAIRQGFRSGLELSIAEALEKKGVSFEFESEHLKYIVPESEHVYTPDFIIITASGRKIYVESKGLFAPEDRKKHILVRDAHPDIDLRFVFLNPNAKIVKNSKTTYAKWAEKNSFQWAAKSIPDEWIAE